MLQDTTITRMNWFTVIQTVVLPAASFFLMGLVTWLLKRIDRGQHETTAAVGQAVAAVSDAAIVASGAAKVAADAGVMRDEKLAEIHVLVNSNLTEQKRLVEVHRRLADAFETSNVALRAQLHAAGIEPTSPVVAVDRTDPSPPTGR